MSARTAKRHTRLYLDARVGGGRFSLPAQAVAILLPYLEPYRDPEPPEETVSAEPFLAEVYARGGGRAAVLLRGARIKAHMAQKDVAAAANVQAAHLSAMERGRRSVGKAVAKRLARGEKTASFQTNQFSAYAFRRIQQFERLLGAMPGDTYPQPVAHCAVCRWDAQCEAQRRRDDHLCSIAL